MLVEQGDAVVKAFTARRVAFTYVVCVCVCVHVCVVVHDMYMLLLP